jgi:3-deoxy-manno-octulosonate cytidylyltransferase (CMP-KDO synthetase)
MSILGIIPARYASTRFPGKPLADINGRAMTLRVCDQALKSGVFSDVLVTTDDERIFDLVKLEGFQVVMTSTYHNSGTERCMEALERWESQIGRQYDHIINIQGDEPFIHPEQIRKVAGLLTDDNAEIATLARLITNQEDLFNPNVVKVVFGQNKNALYFSRSPIPHLRGLTENEWINKATHYVHVGIYGYRSAALKKACSLPPGILEKLESLEQLRWLEQGMTIKVDITTEESFAIDTPEDLLKIKKMQFDS